MEYYDNEDLDFYSKKEFEKRIRKSKLIESDGGNKYRQLEARLLDEKTGKFSSPISRYAIINLIESDDVIDFCCGYVDEVETHLSSYDLNSKSEAKKFVIKDIDSEIRSQFYDSHVYGLWNPILRHKI